MVYSRYLFACFSVHMLSLCLFLFAVGHRLDSLNRAMSTMGTRKGPAIVLRLGEIYEYRATPPLLNFFIIFFLVGGGGRG